MGIEPQAEQPIVPHVVLTDMGGRIHPIRHPIHHLHKAVEILAEEEAVVDLDVQGEIHDHDGRKQVLPWCIHQLKWPHSRPCVKM